MQTLTAFCGVWSDSSSFAYVTKFIAPTNHGNSYWSTWPCVRSPDKVVSCSIWCYIDMVFDSGIFYYRMLLFKISIVSLNSIQLLHTFLGNSENYRPSVLWMTWCTIAWGRKASGDSALGRPQHRGAIVYNYFMPAWGIVKTAAPRCCGQLDALLPEAKRPRTMVHRAVHDTEGQ